jgi:Zn-dependent membrane protease YugP
MPWILDPTFILLIPPMLLAAYATMKVKSTFAKYAQVGSASGVTGAEAARGILRADGVDVAVERTRGSLSDHYDPKAKVLRLSEPVHDSPSLAALGVAAHEAGHALQDKQAYAPLKLRQGIWPVAAFGSNLGPILAMVGIVMLALSSGQAAWAETIAKIGIFVFAGATFFAVLTLPVEINASRRALALLTSRGYITATERPHAKKVLDAAALTYLASAFMAVMMLLRFVLLLASVSRHD